MFLTFNVTINSRYGGVYLDSDVIVLKPLYSLKNSIGIENEMDGDPTFNGAVMAFDKHRYLNRFICWNYALLLSFSFCLLDYCSIILRVCH